MNATNLAPSVLVNMNVSKSMQKNIKTAVSIIGLLAISACGGGSSSSGGDTSTGTNITAFTKFSEVPDNGITELDGQAVSASYTSDESGNITSISSIEGPSDATAQITTQNGLLVALSVNAPSSSVNFDTRDGDSIDIDGLIFAETANEQDAAFFADPEEGGYQYQTFGAWITGYDTGSGTAGAGSFGARTDPSNMPSGTTATYNGFGTGVAKLGDNQPYITVSEVSVVTDFSSVSIASENTEAINVNTGSESLAPGLDYSGTGSVSGSSFVANISGPATSGTATGVFYGPSANEVGGTFSATGAGISHAGSFGGN